MTLDFQTRTPQVHTDRGFSLIELLVTITIVTLITALVMVRYSAFDSSILLNNQAYEIALDIRETQVRSISVQVGNDGTDSFSSNFGLHFNIDTPTEYIFFQDRQIAPGIGVYGPGNEEVGSPFTLDLRFELAVMYINGNTSNQIDDASIVFRRPNFDARIDSESTSDQINSLHIVVASVRNPAATRTVIVYNSGQITVD